MEGASSIEARDIHESMVAADRSCASLLPTPDVTFGCIGRMHESGGSSAILFLDAARRSQRYYSLYLAAGARWCAFGEKAIAPPSPPVENSIHVPVHTVCRFHAGKLVRFTDGAIDGSAAADSLPERPARATLVIPSVPDGDRELDDCFVHSGKALSDRDVCRIWACNVSGSACTCKPNGDWASRGRWDERPGRCLLPERCDQPAPDLAGSGSPGSP